MLLSVLYFSFIGSLLLLLLHQQSSVFALSNKRVYSIVYKTQLNLTMSSGPDASNQSIQNSSISGNSTQPTATAGSGRCSHSPDRSPAPPDTPQAQVMIQCNAIVETYRTGVNPSKPDILAQIIRVLTEFFNARPGHDANFDNAL